MTHFDEEKALATMLYLASKRGQINFYALVKTVYFADKRHLQRWGRTITGDRYVRMVYGPVPSAVYDMLKSVRGDRDWRNDLSPYMKIEGNIVAPLAQPDLDQFSESELEVLDEAFNEYGHMNFGELKAASHDAAYNKSDAFYMDEEDLAEDDPDLIAYMKQRSEDERHFEAW